MTRFLPIAWVAATAVLWAALTVSVCAQFETRASFTAGTITGSEFSPYSLVVGDFNRDGKLDVAVVENGRYSGNVMILLGNGDGTFTAGTSYVVAVQPFYATAGSFRNNGILDLVVSDSRRNYVYVMLGNGDGTFQSPVSYPTSGESIMVGVGDFNGGGKTDILALEGYNCNCVEVLPGRGDGTFGTPVTTALPYSQSGYAVAVGDFNGDGKLDVALTGESLPVLQVAILLGNGDGTFRADGYYPVSSDPFSIAAGHFRGGTTSDLAVANLLGNSISALLGNGDGTFQQAVNYDTWFPTWVAVGDLNGDGKEDLVAANSGSPGNDLASTVSVFMGNGDGTFQPSVAYPAGRLLNYVAIGDFNGDHKPDLVAVGGSSVITLLNTGVVSFSPTTPLTFPTQLIGTTSAPQTAMLTNNGTSPLTISSVTSSGKPFHMQTTCGGSIAPGGNCTITATFTAAAEDVTTGTVSIHDSASSKPQVVELVGTGTVVKLSPRQLNFPPQKSGTTSHSQSIQLTNTGTAALDFTSKISIGYGRAFFESNNCPTSLNAGASCSIHVVFAPRYKGTFSESVFITDTGGGSPQSVPLTGTGD